MVRGLYTAWTGMLTEQKKLDIIANNVANASTTGYKAEDMTIQSFDEHLTIKIRDREQEYDKDEIIGRMTLGVKIGQNYTDYSQGSLKETENTYDLAIQGNGFFRMAVVDSAGNEHIRYTRAGNFTVNAEGTLMDTAGNRVQGEEGDVVIPTDARVVSIDKTGRVYADGEQVATITLVDFADYKYLKKYQDTMYEPVKGYEEIEATGTIKQGFTESSNVNVIRQITNLIALQRAYDASQKVIQTMDSTIQKADSVGSVSR